MHRLQRAVFGYAWKEHEAAEAKAGRYSFTTWEEYVGERWDMTPQRSGQMIIAAESVAKLETIVSLLPTRESHVRELLKLETDDQRAEVWQRSEKPGSRRIA